MAFNLQNFQFARGVDSSYAQGQGVTTIQHTYKSAADTRATIAGVGYFPPFIDGDADKVFVNDSLFIVGSDGASLVIITSLNPVTLGTDLLVSGPTLSMGAPIAAVDPNAARISGNTLQIEIADATHPGSVSINNQTFSGIKAFNDGINVFGQGVSANKINATGAFPLIVGDVLTTSVDVTPIINAIGGVVTDNIQGSGTAANMEIATNIAGNPLALYIGSTLVQVRVGGELLFINGGAAIGYFAEASGSLSWSGAFTVPQAVNFYLSKVNDRVTLIIKGMTAAAAAGAASVPADSGVVIPAAYRPLATVQSFVVSTSNGTQADSYCEIHSDGHVAVFANGTGALFANAGNNEIGDISATYMTV